MHHFYLKMNDWHFDVNNNDFFPYAKAQQSKVEMLFKRQKDNTILLSVVY